MVSSGRVEKSPHEQEIKFFAKVSHVSSTSACCCWVQLRTRIKSGGPWFSKFLLPPLCWQILLPLVNQYFKNHCLYFLSTPAKVLGSGGHSSNKEKEMIARYSGTALLKHLIFPLTPLNLKSSLCTLTQCSPALSLCHASTLPLLLCDILFSPDLSFAICVTPNISVALFALTVPPFPLLSSRLSIFCKLAALVRHRVSLFGKEPDKWRYAVSPSPCPFLSVLFSFCVFWYYFLHFPTPPFML